MNALTHMQRDILSPLVGKIATGFKYEESPNLQLFSDKFTVRLRQLDRQDSEVFLGIHFKKHYYSHAEEAQVVLNIGINLLNTRQLEIQENIVGFERDHFESLSLFLRQPIDEFIAVDDKTLMIAFAHQEMIFDCDVDENGELFLGWAVN